MAITVAEANGVLADLSTVIPEPLYYESDSYIQTSAGNRLSKTSVLCGSQNIHILTGGNVIVKPHAVLRGDLAPFQIGKHVIIGASTTVRPCYKIEDGKIKFESSAIGNFSSIGQNCVVEALSIGNNVMIGDNVVIGNRSVLKNDCVILPGSVLAPCTVVPPNTAFGGCPARLIGELHESAGLIIRNHSSRYNARIISSAVAPPQSIVGSSAPASSPSSTRKVKPPDSKHSRHDSRKKSSSSSGASQNPSPS